MIIFSLYVIDLNPNEVVETLIAQHSIQHVVLRVRLIFNRRFEIKRFEIKESEVHTGMYESSNLFSLCK